MTTTTMRRPVTFVTALAATAGIATVAWAAGADREPAAHRAAAVVADVTTSADGVDRAVTAAAARAGVPADRVTIRRTGGPLEATAAVAALASEAPGAIAGVGPEARAAVGQAESAELARDTAFLKLP